MKPIIRVQVIYLSTCLLLTRITISTATAATTTATTAVPEPISLSSILITTTTPRAVRITNNRMMKSRSSSLVSANRFVSIRSILNGGLTKKTTNTRNTKVFQTPAFINNQKTNSCYNRLLSTSTRPTINSFMNSIDDTNDNCHRRLYSSTSVLSSTKFELAHRLDGLDAPTVWHEFSPLSVQHSSINLGQGFPDWEPPNFVKQCMYDAIYTDNMNQYARSYAHIPLASILADEYNERFQLTTTSTGSTTIDPTTMVATAVGCTNVLYCALHGLLNPGDEVICFEPSFDIYSSQVRMAGGTPVFVPFRDPTGGTSINVDDTKLQYANDKFTIDFNELEAAITPRTKVLLINTPHNPTGKMFTRYELDTIASIVQKYPHVTVISDEVYEHIVFTEADGTKVEHISIASIPDMFDRTLTLSSSGKTFSCTGWKVGWAIGPAHLIKAVTAVQQWVNFSAPTPNQHAIAKALQIAKQPYDIVTGADETTEGGITTYNSYYEWLSADYQRKRQLLISALQAAGMKPIIPHGGFFIMADTSTIDFPYDDMYKYQVTDAMPKLIENDTIYMPRDWALSRWLTEVVGVTAIPPSAFYCLERVPLAKNYLRFAFCKGDTTLIQAHDRFESFFASSKIKK